jgi:intein/homing endonuclease
VFNINNKPNRITKLYWNGESNTRRLSLSDGSIVESTLEHKFLVKINNKEAVWRKSCDLKKGDKIIKK